MIAIIIRTLLLFALIIIVLRLIGKRQIGELEPSELVVTVLISELATIPMQDISSPLASGLVPVVTLLAAELLCSRWVMKDPRFRSLVCGKPSIVVAEGAPVESAMRQNSLTIDELTEELRKQGVTDIATVKYAVLETSGKMSIIQFAEFQPATPHQMGLSSEDAGFPTIIINDGRLLENNLKLRGLDGRWLKEQLKKRGCDNYKNAFLFSVDEQGCVFFVPKEEQK